MNVKKILNHFGIDFTETHSSVGKGTVGIDCPFCSDSNKHLGIFLDRGNYSCWKCGAKGSLFRLLKTLKGIQFEEYSEQTGWKDHSAGHKVILDGIFNPTRESHIIPSNIKEIEQYLRPVEKYYGIRQALRKYLDGRRLSIETLNQNGCFFAPLGPMKERIVIPIPHPSFNLKPIAYIGRAIQDSIRPKYLLSTGFEKSHYLYFNKSVNPDEPLYLVEGIFDSWAFRTYQAVTILGKVISTEQINQLIKLEVNEIVVCLDGDAKIDGVKLSRTLSSHFITSHILLPDKEDPWSLGFDKLKSIIQRRK